MRIAALFLLLLLLSGCSHDPIKESAVRSISDVYDDTLALVKNGHRVLVIELDGYGLMMMDSEAMPFLTSHAFDTALAAFPPISPVGLATMLTGKQPREHGITSRDTREVKCPDLFRALSDMGLKARYIEGDSALIKTSLAPILSPDLNGILGTDDEVFENAMSADAADFMFVHFHGIDDVATAKGPYSPEVKERMRVTDEYVRALAENFSGKVIVTADHGLHEDGDGGAHGEYTREDMLVPYFIFDGGAYAEEQ